MSFTFPLSPAHSVHSFIDLLFPFHGTSPGAPRSLFPPPSSYEAHWYVSAPEFAISADSELAERATQLSGWRATSTLGRRQTDSDMMVQGSPSVATMGQKVRGVRQVPLKDCGQMVLSPIMDSLLVLGIPVVPLICPHGGAELLTPALHDTDLFCVATKNQSTATCRTAQTQSYRPL